MGLRQLEMLLDMRLFDRVGKRLVLNSNGQVLLPKATAIVDQAKDIEYYMHGEGKSEKIQGEVRIGASVTLGHYMLPMFMAGFKELHPYVDFTLQVENTRKVLEQCDNLDIDMGIIEGNVNSEKVDVISWKVDELVVIARKGHPLVKKKLVDFHDLSNYHWVMREEGSGTEEIISAYARDKFTFSTEVVLTNFEAIKKYVANSNCLSCLSSATINLNKNAELRMLSVDGFKLIRPLSIIRHKDKFCSLASDCFQSYLFNQQ